MKSCGKAVGGSRMGWGGCSPGVEGSSVSTCFPPLPKALLSCRMLITLLKYKPQISPEQLGSVMAAFSAMRERCCGEADPEACFLKEVSLLFPAKVSPKFLANGIRSVSCPRVVFQQFSDPIQQDKGNEKHLSLEHQVVVKMAHFRKSGAT